MKQYVVNSKVTDEYLIVVRGKTTGTKNISEARVYNGIGAIKMSLGDWKSEEKTGRVSCDSCGGTGFIKYCYLAEKYVLPECFEIIEVVKKSTVEKV